jgi:nicotinate-nucleotide adenylyltransferase
LRLGILGGTFNPPHLGHLICAQEALVELELDRIVLIPTGRPPHKTVDEDPGAEHRLALCAAAVGADERLDVSDVEVGRSGTSYTVDTLNLLHSQAPDNELFFIVGADAAAGLPSWRDPQGVLSLATVAVAARRGTRKNQVREALCEVEGGERSVFFKMPRIGISSTSIRGRVRAGRPIRYLVPEPVSSYIAEHGLYREEASR